MLDTKQKFSFAALSSLLLLVPFILDPLLSFLFFFTYSPPLYLVQEKVPIIEAKSSFSFFFCFFFLPFPFLFPFVTGNVSAKAWSKQNLVAIMISKHHDGQRHFLLSFFFFFFKKTNFIFSFFLFSIFFSLFISFIHIKKPLHLNVNKTNSLI